MNIQATGQEFTEEVSAASSVYRLLSTLFLREVDVALLEQLSGSAVRDPFVNAGGSIPDENGVEELALDYCQLFLGPSGHLPPFQSVWQSGQYQSHTVSSMRQFIEVARYPISDTPHNTMPDHFGVQLGVMGHVLGQCKPSPVGPVRDVKSIAEFANAFLVRHLLWPEPMLLAAIEKAQSSFYQSVLKLAREFLVSEWSFWGATEKPPLA